MGLVRRATLGLPRRQRPVDTPLLDLCVDDGGAVRAAAGARVPSVAGVHRLDLFTAGGAMAPLAELPGSLEGARFSHDCSKVAAVVRDGAGATSLQVFDTSDGRSLGMRALPSPDARVAWSPDGARLAIAVERAVVVWSLDGDPDAVVLPDGALGALIGADGRARDLGAVPEGARAWLQSEVIGPVRYGILLPERFASELYGLSPDGRHAARARGARLTVFDLAGASPAREVDLASRAGWLRLSPDNASVAVGTGRGVELRALPDGSLRCVVPSALDAERFSWSSDGAAVISRDGHAWSARDCAASGARPTPAGPPPASPPRRAGASRAEATSPDGSLTASSDGRDVTLTDARTRRVVTTLRSILAVDALAFSPDGTLLVATSEGRHPHAPRAALVWAVRPTGVDAPGAQMPVGVATWHRPRERLGRQRADAKRSRASAKLRAAPGCARK